MLTETERKDVIKLVVMMCDAAPGATYLAHAMAAYEANGKSLPELAKSIAASDVYKSMHPDYQTANDFARDLLQPFGFDESHYLVALASHLFQSTWDKGEAASTILAIIDAARDPDLVKVQATIANRVDVAEYASVTLNVAETDVLTLNSFIAKVDESVSSVIVAKAVLDTVYGPGVAGGLGASKTLSTGALVSTANPVALSDPDLQKFASHSVAGREVSLSVGDDYTGSQGAEWLLAGVVTAHDDGPMDLNAGLPF